jgi:hypothetical protein
MHSKLYLIDMTIKYHVEYVDIDGRIILKCIFKEAEYGM